MNLLARLNVLPTPQLNILSRAPFLRSRSYLLASTGTARDRAIIEGFVEQCDDGDDATLVLWLSQPVHQAYVEFVHGLLADSRRPLPDVMVIEEGHADIDLPSLLRLIDVVIDDETAEFLVGRSDGWRYDIDADRAQTMAAAVTPTAPIVETPAEVDDGSGPVRYPSVPAVSYAQNREDVLLRRVFGDRGHGRYVDVGAGHPITDSVTKAFSLRGWTGINLEANPALCQLLAKDRPLDVNLPVAVSNRTGVSVFSEGDDSCWGLSTLDVGSAQLAANLGYRLRRTIVPTVTLVEILDAAGYVGYDLLKIDVEGHEREVLEGAGLTDHPARVVVIEAVLPNSSVRIDEQWSELLLSAGYIEAAFDGINCYFVQERDRVARRQLSVPANVLDLIARP